MHTPRRPANEIAEEICRLQPGRQRRADMPAVVKQEIDGLVELSERFAPMLEANQVAKEAKSLVKTTARLQRAYRKLAKNPLLASPLLDRPAMSFAEADPRLPSFAEADPQLERAPLVLALVPKLTEEIALDRPPGVDLQFAADTLKRAGLVLDWLAKCCGAEGHTAFTKRICAVGALRLIERGLDRDKDCEITKLLFEAVTETPDHRPFAFKRALDHARKTWNAKRKD